MKYDKALYITNSFLSPDPIVQTEGGSQSMNAYSYALNNPLKYTDPTGYKTFGTSYSVDYAGMNSAMAKNHYDYYNQIYGRQEFWNTGGTNLTQMTWSNSGGGFSANGVFDNVMEYLSYRAQEINNRFSDALSTFNPSGNKVKGFTKEDWLEALDRARKWNSGEDITFLINGVATTSNVNDLSKSLRDVFRLVFTPSSSIISIDLVVRMTTRVPSGWGLYSTGEYISNKRGKVEVGFTTLDIHGEAHSYISPWAMLNGNKWFRNAIIGHEYIHLSITYGYYEKKVCTQREYNRQESIATSFQYNYLNDNTPLRTRYIMDYHRSYSNPKFSWIPYITY